MTVYDGYELLVIQTDANSSGTKPDLKQAVQSHHAQGRMQSILKSIRPSISSREEQ